MVAWEFARFFLRLYEEVQDADTLEEVMSEALVFAHNAVVEHEVLQRVLQTEPEVLLPRFTTEANQTHKGGGCLPGALPGSPRTARKGP